MPRDGAESLAIICPSDHMLQSEETAVILAEPPPSEADIHFRLFGFPVRIHPFFWVISLILALRGGAPPVQVLCWVVAVFVSILVHELGHGLMQRRYGGQPRIVLHGMGGLAICGDCERSPRSQIIISLAGPAAGFALAAAFFLGVALLGHQPRCAVGDRVFGADLVAGTPIDGIRILGMQFVWDAFRSPHMNLLLKHFLWINVLWGVINLLPIYPLDGGQVARELCLLGSPREGIILSLRLSAGAAIAMALVGIFWQSLLVALMFGYFAYSSYKTLEAYRASHW
ncbi:MAG: site-2 protease family protein [Pirellulales bacterium]|nr:site-2 protease family protein [Pirellulales bacterium]